MRVDQLKASVFKSIQQFRRCANDYARQSDTESAGEYVDLVERLENLSARISNDTFDQCAEEYRRLCG